MSNIHLYREYENLLLDRLAPLESDNVNLSSTTDSYASSGRVSLDINVNVRFTGETLDAPKSPKGVLGIVGQPIIVESILHYDIEFEAKDLRSHDRIYPILDRTRVLLLGWVLKSDKSCGSILVKSILPKERDKKGNYTVWTMAVEFTIIRKSDSDLIIRGRSPQEENLSVKDEKTFME